MHYPHVHYTARKSKIRNPETHTSLKTRFTNLLTALVFAATTFAGAAPLLLTNTAVAAGSQTADHIVINEVMPNPNSGDQWVELYNPNPKGTSVKIGSYRVMHKGNNSSHFGGVIPDGTTIEGHDFYVLKDDDALPKSGSTVQLYKDYNAQKNDETLDTLTYAEQDPGSSTGLKADGVHNSPSDVTTFTNPTKGESNTSNSAKPSTSVSSLAPGTYTLNPEKDFHVNITAQNLGNYSLHKLRIFLGDKLEAALQAQYDASTKPAGDNFKLSSNPKPFTFCANTSKPYDCGHNAQAKAVFNAVGIQEVKYTKSTKTWTITASDSLTKALENLNGSFSFQTSLEYSNGTNYVHPYTSGDYTYTLNATAPSITSMTESTTTTVGFNDNFPVKVIAKPGTNSLEYLKAHINNNFKDAMVAVLKDYNTANGTSYPTSAITNYMTACAKKHHPYNCDVPHGKSRTITEAAGLTVNYDKGSYTWTITASPALIKALDGNPAKISNVKVVDDHRNTSQLKSRTYTLKFESKNKDTEAPTISMYKPAGNWISSNSRLVIRGNYKENGSPASGLHRIYITFDEFKNGKKISGTHHVFYHNSGERPDNKPANNPSRNGNWSFTVPKAKINAAGLENGEKIRINVIAHDNARNSYKIAKKLTVDNDAPTGTITKPSGKYIRTSANLKINGTYTEHGDSGIYRVYLYLAKVDPVTHKVIKHLPSIPTDTNGIKATITKNGDQGTWGYTVSANKYLKKHLSDGDGLRVIAVLKDKAGNLSGRSLMRYYTIDDELPTATLKTPSSKYVKTDKGITFTGRYQAHGGSGVEYVYIYVAKGSAYHSGNVFAKGTATRTTGDDTSGTWRFHVDSSKLSSVDDGNDFIVLVAPRDNAGNSSYYGSEHIFTVDNYTPNAPSGLYFTVGTTRYDSGNATNHQSTDGSLVIHWVNKNYKHQNKLVKYQIKFQIPKNGHWFTKDVDIKNDIVNPAKPYTGFSSFGVFGKEGTYKFKMRVQARNGVWSEYSNNNTPVTLVYDATKPAKSDVSVSLSKTQVSEGDTSTVTISAKDNAGGSGIDHVQYWILDANGNRMIRLQTAESAGNHQYAGNLPFCFAASDVNSMLNKNEQKHLTDYYNYDQSNNKYCLKDGTYSVRARAYDNAGNVRSTGSSGKDATFTIDTKAPAASSDSPEAGSGTDGMGGSGSNDNKGQGDDSAGGQHRKHKHTGSTPFGFRSFAQSGSLDGVSRGSNGSGNGGGLVLAAVNVGAVPSGNGGGHVVAAQAQSQTSKDNSKHDGNDSEAGVLSAQTGAANAKSDGTVTLQNSGNKLPTFLGMVWYWWLVIAAAVVAFFIYLYWRASTDNKTA
jgi:hypothetical protein